MNRKSRRHADEDCGQHIGWNETHDMEDHLWEHVVGVSQPALSKVSKQLRTETLAIFYGEPIFMFTAFKFQEIFEAPMAWMKQIGSHNAALVEKVMVVLPRMSGLYGRILIKAWLSRQLKSVGAEPVVKLKSYKYGRCRCETCVLRKEESKIREVQ